MTFVLDKQIERDSVFVQDLKLCTVRLSKNAAFPWLVLIPKRPNMAEILDLNEEDRQVLYSEIEHCARALQKLFKPTKLNIANIGNVVSQLHIHVIARFKTDPAWPNPVWNSGVMKEYSEAELDARLASLRTTLAQVLQSK